MRTGREALARGDGERRSVEAASGLCRGFGAGGFTASVLALAQGLCGSLACLDQSAGAAERGSVERRATAGGGARRPSTAGTSGAPGAWRAPPACPSEARFRREVGQRAGAAGGVDVAERASVQVRELGPGRWVGSVSFEHEGRTLEREVSGADCEEVVVALALITSLWLRPGRPEPSGPPAPARAREEGPRAAVPLSPPAPPEPLSRPSAAAAPPTGGARRPLGSESGGGRGSARRGASARVGLGGFVGFASEPSGAVAARLRGELWHARSPSSEALALGAAVATGRHTDDRLGAARLHLLYGQVDACPPGAGLGAGWWLRACAQGRAGALRFSSSSSAVMDVGGPRWRPWASLGLGLHAGLELSRAVSLRLVAEGSALLIRDEFVVLAASAAGPPSSVTFYRPAPAMLDIGMGVVHAF